MLVGMPAYLIAVCIFASFISELPQSITALGVHAYPSLPQLIITEYVGIMDVIESDDYGGWG